LLNVLTKSRTGPVDSITVAVETYFCSLANVWLKSMEALNGKLPGPRFTSEQAKQYPDEGSSVKVEKHLVSCSGHGQV
jgi:hypothetical protein